MNPANRRWIPSWWLVPCLTMLLAAPVPAFQRSGSGSYNGTGAVLPATGTIEVAFTPGDDAGKLIADTIDGAQREVLVQAFSFTHRKIADALIAARNRGVDVKVIADPDQADRIPTSVIARMAKAKVPVFTDSEHTSAHNKVMIIDAGGPNAVLVTGSFNFTHAAQYKNAENVLIFRGNQPLAETYLKNWHRHYKHSRPYRPKR